MNDTPALPFCDLCENVCGSAKSVEAKRFTLAGHAIAPPADQTCAKPGRDLQVIEFANQRKAETSVCDRMRGEAAIPRIAGKNRPIAKIFAVAAAKAAEATSAAQPWHPNAIAYPQCLDARPYYLDAADDFVTGDDRQPRMRQFAIGHMQIGAANSAGLYRYPDFAGACDR